MLDTVVGAFYYLGDGEVFNGDDCFYIEVKRKDDGVVMRTCEICPGIDTPIDNVCAYDNLLRTTVVNRGEYILLENLEEAFVGIYTYTGLLVGSYKLCSNSRQIVVPDKMGLSIVKIETEEVNLVYKIWVK